MSKSNPKTANNGNSNQNTATASAATVNTQQAAVETKQEDSAQDASQSEDKANDTGATQSAPSVSNEAAAPVAVQESSEDRVVTPTASPVVVEKPVVVAEPEPTPAPKVETVAAPADSTVVVVDAVTPVAKNAELKNKLASIMRTVPETHHGDITRVLAYLEAMAPKRPINPKDGAKEQVALYRSIQNIINRQEEHFTPLFSALLHIFKSEFNGALGDRYRLRFLESIELGAGDRKAFQKITHLLHITADPVGRERALKTIDIARAVENGLTAQGQSRVLNFYNV